MPNVLHMLILSLKRILVFNEVPLLLDPRPKEPDDDSKDGQRDSDGPVDPEVGPDDERNVGGGPVEEWGCKEGLSNVER